VLAGPAARDHGQRRTYLVDVTVSPRERDAFDDMARSWDAQVGTAVPIAPATILGEGDCRVRIRHGKVGDVIVEDLYSEHVVGGTGGAFNHHNDRVILHVGRRGSWHFSRASGRGDALEAGRGQFVARLNDPAWLFGVGPGTRSTVLVLPATPELRSLVASRPVAGPATSAQMRVLMAHVAAVQETLDDLSEAGVAAARNAMIELTRGVLSGEGPDASEPLLAPALAAAARRVAERLLTDADLSPGLLARELNVSVRTLQRAFAETGEPATSYIRRRRLERARAELISPGPPVTVSELAARCGFADSSHFIRLFKKEYGHSPARLARLHRQGPRPS
jgi:AraC-like DNA-binding protein